MTRLTGAAANAHARRILIDEARDLMAQRPHVSSVYIVGLLMAADAKTPRRTPAEPEVPLVVTRFTGHGLGHVALAGMPSIRLTPLTSPSRVPTPGPQVTAAHEHGHRVPRKGRAL